MGLGVAFDGGGVVGGGSGEEKVDGGRRSEVGGQRERGCRGSPLRFASYGGQAEIGGQGERSEGSDFVDEGVEAFVVALEGGDAADDEGVFGNSVLTAVRGFLFGGGGGEMGGVDEAGDEEVEGSAFAKGYGVIFAALRECTFGEGGIVVGLGDMLEVGEAGESGGGFVGDVAEDDAGVSGVGCRVSGKALGDNIVLGMDDIEERRGALARKPPQECAGEESLLQAVTGGQAPAPGELRGETGEETDGEGIAVEVVELDVGTGVGATAVQQDNILAFAVEGLGEGFCPSFDPSGGVAEAGGEDSDTGVPEVGCRRSEFGGYRGRMH